jgi:hypothetical protein
MKNGFKQNKGPTTKERIEALKIELKNLSQAFQIQQMMIKHMSNQIQGLDTDAKNSMSMLNDFQYRTLAMIELADYSTEDLEEKAAELKLNDFNKASDLEDQEKSYELDNDGEINEDSIVVICSEVEDNEDAGIFRSKFPMSECLTPDIREKLLGCKVGDKIEAEIYGLKHTIEVLSLRKPPVKEEEKEEQE